MGGKRAAVNIYLVGSHEGTCPAEMIFLIPVDSAMIRLQLKVQLNKIEDLQPDVWGAAFNLSAFNLPGQPVPEQLEENDSNH